jgi:hypothetical protein
MQYVNLAKGKRGFPSATTKLDGIRYTIEAIWNDTEGTWSVQLYDADGVLLRAGLTLRHAVDVLRPFPDAGLPGLGLGQLGAWDFSGLQRDPGRDDLGAGADVRLVYITASEVAA